MSKPFKHRARQGSHTSPPGSRDGASAGVARRSQYARSDRRLACLQLRLVVGVPQLQVDPYKRKHMKHPFATLHLTKARKMLHVATTYHCCKLQSHCSCSLSAVHVSTKGLNSSNFPVLLASPAERAQTKHDNQKGRCDRPSSRCDCHQHSMSGETT